MRTLNSHVRCYRSRRYLRFVATVAFMAAACVSETVAAPTLTINVWCVGSPHNQELPGKCDYALIGQQALKAGLTVAFESIRAIDFVARFQQAIQEKTAPEILMFNNIGILAGIPMPTGRFEGLLEKYPTLAESLTGVHETLTHQRPGGWWTMLVSSATNNDAAKRMALQPLPCPAPSGSSQLPQSELTNVSESAVQVARAYFLDENASLAAASDPARLGNKSFLPGINVTLEKLHTCSVFGNERLAFVTLAGTFLAKKRAPTPTIDYAEWSPNFMLGQQSLLTVFRKHQGQWRLLAISNDPVNTGYSGRPTVVALERLNVLMASADVTTISEGPRLINADGARIVPPPNVRFGDFEWTPSPDATVVCQVAEFLVGRTERETTRLFFLFGREHRLSAGMLFGGRGRWRVWSINSSGDVALSESRAYRTH